MNSLDIQKWRNKYIYQINESDEDEFNVEDVPQHWNVDYLTIKDTITPDMWIDEASGWVDGKTFKIIYTDRQFVTIKDVKDKTSRGTLLFTYGYINNQLKPQYQIVPLIKESDDEEDFNVEDIPHYWYPTELGVGDTITPDMWDGDLIKNLMYVDFKNPIKIQRIKNGLVKFKDGYEYRLSSINDYLKPEYKIVNSMNESDEDEFDIQDVPGHWNVTELHVGDTITPEMWDLNNPELDDYIDNPNEDWLINVGWVKEDIYLTTDTGGELSTDIKDINSLLKPEYRIVNDLNESDEDFNVEVGPWDNLSNEYGELEDEFGGQGASMLRNRFKSQFNSPLELLKMLQGKSNFWMETFIDWIESGDTVEDAIGMADMAQQDRDDIDMGLERAQEILDNNHKLKKLDSEELIDFLWNQINLKDDNYYRDMDTSPRESLFMELENLIDNF